MSDGEPISIAAVGDVMPGISYDWRYLVSPEQYVSHRLVAGDTEIIAPGPRSVLQDADLTFGNMEAVISRTYDNGDSRTPPLLTAPVETAEFLADTGFDVVNIDNNHILDHGEELVEETIEHLDRAGVEHIGSPLGEEEPTTISRNGTPIHLAGYNLCDDGRTSTPEDVRTAARELAGRPGVSILSLHWGWRQVHTLTPSPEQITLAGEIADIGVDVVLGHHSHTFQPVELNDETIVAYSLGNFIFDMFRPDNRESGIVEISIPPDESTDAERQVTVTPVENRDATVRAANIPRISNAVPSDVQPMSADEYEQYAVAARKHHQKEVIKEFARNSHRIPVGLQMETLRGWGTKAARKLWERKVTG